MPERLSGGQAGWNRRWDSVVSGLPGSQKECGCLTAAEFPGTGVGKPSPISKPRSGLSAWCCYKPGTVALSGDHSSRGPKNGRTMGRHPALPQEQQCVSVPQKSTGFGDSKWDCVSELEVLGHRLGEHKVWMETSFSLRTH